MSRWTQYDEDDYRLPEGMKRIGYDSDSGRYYFVDANNTFWQGEPGEHFGEMTRVDELPASLSIDLDDRTGDLEALPRRTNGDYELLSEYPPMAHKGRVNVDSFRTLYPFFLIIAVVLLLVWRLIVSPGLSNPRKVCPEGTSLYWVEPGQNCWEISRQHGWTLEKFKEVNPKVVCDPLMPGTSICLSPVKPPVKENSRRL